MVEQYVRKNWDWRSVSSNPGITMQDIINHPIFAWGWLCVSSNPNMTFAMVKQFLHKAWD